MLSLQTQSYLRNKSWDTRVAAAQTIAAIAKNVKKWEPLYQFRDDNTEDDNGIIFHVIFHYFYEVK